MKEKQTIEFFFDGNDERISDFFKNTERRCNALFLQDAERNAAYLGKFKPGTSCTLLHVHKKLGTLKSTQISREENMCILYKSIQY